MLTGATVPDLRLLEVAGVSQLRIGHEGGPRTTIGNLTVNTDDEAETLMIRDAVISGRVSVRATRLRFLGFHRTEIGSEVVLDEVELRSLALQECVFPPLRGDYVLTTRA